MPVRKREGYRTATTVLPVMYRISDIKITREVINKCPSSEQGHGDNEKKVEKHCS